MGAVLFVDVNSQEEAVAPLHIVAVLDSCASMWNKKTISRFSCVVFTSPAGAERNTCTETPHYSGSASQAQPAASSPSFRQPYCLSGPSCKTQHYTGKGKGAAAHQFWPSARDRFTVRLFRLINGILLSTLCSSCTYTGEVSV